MAKKTEKMRETHRPDPPNLIFRLDGSFRKMRKKERYLFREKVLNPKPYFSLFVFYHFLTLLSILPSSLSLNPLLQAKALFDHVQVLPLFLSTKLVTNTHTDSKHRHFRFLISNYRHRHIPILFNVTKYFEA